MSVVVPAPQNTLVVRSATIGDQAPVRREPPRYKVAVVSWLALYPALNVVFLALEPLGVSAFPLLARTLIVSVILVPTMVYLLVPAVQRILRPWLRS